MDVGASSLSVTRAPRSGPRALPVVRYVDLPLYGTPMRLSSPSQPPLNTASTQFQRPEVDPVDVLLVERAQRAHWHPRAAKEINQGQRTAAR